MDDPTLASVAAIVTRIAGPGRVPDELSRDTSLTEGLWLDSVELLEIIVACENTFQIAFDGDDDLQVGRFETLGSLADAVQNKIVEAER